MALVTRREPICIDCGERARSKFYAHPLNPTGCQRRCKACDNKKRLANVRKASGWTARKVHLSSGKQFSRSALEAMLEVVVSARAVVADGPDAELHELQRAIEHLDQVSSLPSSEESNGEKP